MSFELHPVLSALLAANVRGALLIALVVVLLVALRTRSGSLRYSVWLTAVTGSLLLPLFIQFLPAFAIPVLPPEIPDPMIILPQVGLTPGPGIADASSQPGMPGLALLVIYVLGVFCAFGWFARSLFKVAKLDRAMTETADSRLIAVKESIRADLGILRRVRLLASDVAVSPFTWGLMFPRVVLPRLAEDWSDERLRNVLLHELYHIRRLDWLGLILQQLAVAINWFNPLVWFAVRQCRYEAERACDDFVIRSGGKKADYAEQLVDLMETQRVHAGIALGDGDFSRRIRAILNSSKEGQVMSNMKTNLATAGVAISALVLAACQVTNGQPLEQPGQPAQPLAQQGQQGQQGQQSPRRQLEPQVLEELVAREAQLQVLEKLAARESEFRLLAERLRAETLPLANLNMERLSAETEKLKSLTLEFENRTLALRESQVQLERQQRTIQELEETLSRQTEVLRDRERELAEMQERLAETSGE